ncbi:MAG: hypothetical protein VX670_10910, partial [Candidatus Latescibacterota bacterium]|nr:hypothetical protein [Candidatus Latescibacterota bacterium]
MKIVAAQRAALGIEAEQSLAQFNQAYLERHGASSVGARCAAAEMLLLLAPEERERALQIAMDKRWTYDQVTARLGAALNALPALPPPQPDGQRYQRICRMAYELHRLELEYERIAFVCAVADWPWIRQAYGQRVAYAKHATGVAMPEVRRIAEDCLYFALGELPYITALYEHRRAEMVGDATLAVDGVKSLLLAARDHWVEGQDLA